MKLADFGGDISGDEWLSTIEKAFVLKEVLESKKVKLVALKLRGRAST